MGFDYRPAAKAIAAVGSLASSQADYDRVLDRIGSRFGKRVEDLLNTLLGFEGWVEMAQYMEQHEDFPPSEHAAELKVVRSPEFIEFMNSKEFRKMGVASRLGESRENFYLDAHLQLVGILADAWLGLPDPSGRGPDLTHRDRPQEWEKVAEWLSESGFPTTGCLELDLEALTKKAPRELQQLRVRSKLGESTDVVKRLLQ